MELPHIITTGRYAPNDLEVLHSPSTRKVSPEIELQIEAIWQETLKMAKDSGKVCYNGESYRLNSIIRNRGKLLIDFGRVEYKTRNAFLSVTDLSEMSEPYFCKSCSSSATVKTADGLYVMVELTGKSMNTNAVELVGGIMETNDPKIISGDDIFASFYKELKEEVGVITSEIDDAHLTGIFIEQSTNVCFYFEVSLLVNSQDLLARFETNQDDDIRSINFFSKQEYINALNSHPSSNKQLIPSLLQI